MTTTIDPTTPVTVVEASNATAWDRWVEAHERATLYHRWGWADVLGNALGHRTYRLAAMVDETFVGILPLTLVTHPLLGRSLASMPFLNYGGIVSDNATATAALYEHAIALAQELRAAHLEFRYTHAPSGDYPIKTEKATYRLPLMATDDETFARFRKATRNRIRKTADYNLRLERGNDTAMLNDFYRGFGVAMKEHGTPVLPKQFFAELIDVFGDAVRLYVGYSDAQVAGVKCTITWRDTMYQIWGGYPNAHKKELANYLLSWEATRDAIADRLQFCDFGRSTIGSGPASFKRHFGCDEEPMYWEYPYLASGELPAIGAANTKLATAVKIWRRLPLTLTNTIGPWLSRGLP